MKKKILVLILVLFLFFPSNIMFNLVVAQEFDTEEAMDYLRKGGKEMYATVQMLKGINY